MAAQLGRFLSVGGATFVIYFVLQYGFERAGIDSYVALSLAYAIAITYHYLMNRTYTFGKELTLSGTPASIGKYAAVNLLNYGITLVVVRLVGSFGLDIKVGMVIAIIITMSTGYIMYRHWVFSR